jgi:sirohydrochlorin ferrochelatase
MASSNRPNSGKLAVVLIAHGSRNASANADALHFLNQLRAAGVAHHLEAAFLELAEPDIATAMRRCLQIMPDVVVLLPFFLSPGVHVRRDLAEMCREFENAHAEVRFILAEPLGRHDLLTRVLMERLRESLADCGTSPTEWRSSPESH